MRDAAAVGIMKEPESGSLLPDVQVPLRFELGEVDPHELSATLAAGLAVAFRTVWEVLPECVQRVLRAHWQAPPGVTVTIAWDWAGRGDWACASSAVSARAFHFHYDAVRLLPPKALAALTAHEVAHAWLDALRVSEDASPDARILLDILPAGVPVERAADGLAQAWGFLPDEFRQWVREHPWVQHYWQQASPFCRGPGASGPGDESLVSVVRAAAARGEWAAAVWLLEHKLAD